MRPHLPSTTRVLTAVVAAFALATVGCEEEHVEWLPDSSGFVFTDKGHTRLVQYDVGKKAKRVVVEDAKIKCAWPAVSPDGTQFAMATETSTCTTGSREVTRKTWVVIYDRDGAEKQRSKVFESTETSTTPAKESGTSTTAGYVGWKGHKDRLVVPVLTPGNVESAIYDRAKDKWVTAPGYPCAIPLHAFAPTEKGFFTVREVKAKYGDQGMGREVISFVDWDGWSADIETPSDLKVGRGVQGKWEGDAYVVTGDGKLTIDTATRKVQVTAGADPTWEALHRPEQYHRLAGGDLYLTVFSEYEKGAMQTKTRLELQVPEKKRRKVIYTEGEYTSVTLFPSPDGKRVAAWCKRPGETEVYDPKQGKTVPRVPPLPAKSTIVVFDDAGEVVGSVDPE